MSPSDMARRRILPVLVIVLAAALGGHPRPARGEGDDHCLFTLKGHAGIAVSVTYLPRGDRLASAGRDNQVLIWDAATGKRLSTLTLTDEGEAHRYCVSCGTQRKVLTHPPRGLSGRLSVDYTFAYEKTTLAYCKSDHGKQKGEIVLWDPETKKELRVLRGHTHAVNSVSCSPDGRLVGSGGYDSTARVWDAGSGRELFTFTGHTGTVYVVAFDPAGKLLASGSADKQVILWDAGTGHRVHTLVGHTATVYGVAFSHDGKRVATCGDDQTVRVWDVATGKHLLTLTGHAGSVGGVAFSADDRLIATGSNDNTVKLWDAASGKELATLKGHTGLVRCVAFNPVKPQVASASWDQTVKVWDVSRVKPEAEKK
jgi:WD40 repeat protein